MKKIFWASWIVLTIVVAAYYGYMMWFGEDKSQLLIGETTYGHYQIEMACESCHTSPFGGEDVLQNACMNCHAEELEAVNDSHPKSKFTDPRNADLLEVIDARYCVSCHTEHHKDKTLAMGLTLPDDYCYHCHVEIGEDRESHKNLPFDSCASAGCHNYHDNLALYEGFLLRHANEPVLKAIAELPVRNAELRYQQKAIEREQPVKALTIADVDLSSFKGELTEEITHDWMASSHARNGVECMDCHVDNAVSEEWIEKPDHKQCQSCHTRQVKGLLEGKHGMRLADTVSQPLTAISPGESELEFKEDALGITHSCNACHSSHEFNTQTDAVGACLGCHNDDHSLAFIDSPHFGLLEKEQSGELPENSGVSCATCHMPRMVKGKGERQTVWVEHNQNLTLRPNEKMIRPVCMNCHGLAFSIDALADPELIKNNFNGQPSEHIPSIDWALKRENE